MTTIRRESRTLVELYADPETGLCDPHEHCAECPVYDSCPFNGFLCQDTPTDRERNTP